MPTGLFNLKQVNQAISQGSWSGYIAPRWVEYLVVAGGGSGGVEVGTNTGAGGGGAGGLLTGIVTVATGASYTVTVGGGGAAISASTTGNTGLASVFGAISASGGGGGGSAGYVGTNALSGGSGGGGVNQQVDGSTYPNGTPGNGVSGQGNAGGAGYGNGSSSLFGPGGGGGGAGTIGLTGLATVAGNGGAGIASAITGTVVTYAGGGGGSHISSSTAGTGGVGGGGAGGAGASGTNGSANTGGGGGAMGRNGSTSGAGGSGIVVVRYPGNVQFFTGGTVNYNNGYIIHIFTASGTLAPTTPTVYNTSYQISRSLRFNSPDSAYLNRTPASAGNRQIFTFSAWVKRSKLSTATTNMFGGGASATNFTEIYFSSSDDLRFYDYASSTSLYSSSVYRDVSAWYHIVYAIDTTQATAANRVKIYVNGTQLTSFATANYPAQNANMYINTAGVHSLGALNYTASIVDYFDGYMTEINFIDGQALTPSSFGATSTTNGVWAPIQYTGTYGTNGFYVNFSDNSNTTAATLGKDYSGNGNNWTPNNFSVTAGAGNDSMVDSPTQYGFDTGVGGTVRGNYCTLNPINSASGITNGNLDFVVSDSTAYGSIGFASGKWYWEMLINNRGDSVSTGIALDSLTATNRSYLGTSGTVYTYLIDGTKYNGATASAYGASFTTGDIISVAYDADAGSITFYKNGTSQGVAFTGLTGGFKPFAQGYLSSPSVSMNFGQRPFAYTAPSGFQALCTQNLPMPTIGATSATLAGKYFNPVLYTGTGSSQSITGVGFQPDWTWIKSRSAATNHSLYDAVRGVQKQLVITATAETTETTGLTAFGSDGFTVGALAQLNTSAATYVAWNWRAGNNAGASNSAGSITSTVSVNTTSGFSIVTYAGQASAGTVGHGLGVAPSMIIIKSRTNTYGWIVWHSAFNQNEYLILETTDAKGTTTNYWNSSAPSTWTSAFGVGASPKYNNADGQNHVAYCFAAVPGYSAFGSYTGNGSADGPFVYTGFRPAFIMVKASSGGSAASANWLILDTTRNTYNVTNNKLAPNLSEAENGASIGTSADNNYDLLSNGFKARTTNGSSNENGTTFIYMALASNPFKYSLAR